MSRLKPPAQALHDQLVDVDAVLQQADDIQRERGGAGVPFETAMALSAWGHMKATCALVHAVRELTEVLRELRRPDAR